MTDLQALKAFEEDSRFYVSGIEFHIWEGHRIFIYDRELQKPVKIITVKDGKVNFRDLDVDDMKCE